MIFWISCLSAIVSFAASHWCLYACEFEYGLGFLFGGFMAGAIALMQRKETV